MVNRLAGAALSFSGRRSTVRPCTRADFCADLIASKIATARPKVRVQAYYVTSLPITRHFWYAKRRGLDVAAILDRNQDRRGHEVCRRLVEQGNDKGFTSIIYRNNPPKIEPVFEGEEHVIRFDGERWRCDP